MAKHLSLAAATFLAVVICAIPSGATDWARFRGADGAGIGAGSLPRELNVEKNLRWKAASGKGASSPVVAGGRVFLTGFEGDQRWVKCIDAASGELLWQQALQSRRKEVATAPGGPASPTPVADAQRVYAFFPDVGLACYSHAGEQQWLVELGPFYSFHGVAASLVLAEGNVFVLVDQLADSFLAALDCRTGKETWRAQRQDGAIGGYSTPATRRTAAGKIELVVSGPLELVGYDASSGARNWSIEGITSAPISVPVVAGNLVLVCEPSFAQNPFKIDTLLVHDKDKDGEISLAEAEKNVPLYRIVKKVDAGWGNGDGKVDAEELEKAFKSFVGGGGLAAVQIDEPAGQAATASVKWTYKRSVPQIPSLLVYDGVMFFISDGGILTSVDPNTGEILKRGRLNHGSKYYASPVAAVGRLMVVDTEGKIAVVSAQAQWEVLGTSDVTEKCYATPAIAAGKVFVRGEGSLFCFGAEGE